MTHVASSTVATLGVLSALLLGGCDLGATTVGPEGGLVVSSDGRVSLDIPAGALDRELEISIEPVDDAPEGAIGGAYAIEPRLVSLDRPATLTYELAAMGDAGAALSAEALPELEIVMQKANGWAPLADRELDLEVQTISASVMVFSDVALVVR